MATVGASVDPSVELNLVPLLSKIANDCVVSTPVMFPILRHVVSADAAKDCNVILDALSSGVDQCSNTVGESPPMPAIDSIWLPFCLTECFGSPPMLQMGSSMILLR